MGLSFSSRETISGGIKPIDFVPIMGIREVGPLISRKRRRQSVSASHFPRFLQSLAIVGITLYFYSSGIHPDTQLSLKIDIDILQLSSVFFFFFFRYVTLYNQSREKIIFR